MRDIAARLIRLLGMKEITLATAESCTGGLIASSIVAIPGASAVFEEGCVTYSNAAKTRRLGVREETLAMFGAVSEETAIEMAQGAARTSGASAAIATTGIAGPDGGSVDKPVGLVWIAAYYDGRVRTRRLNLPGGRDSVRTHAAAEAMKLLICAVART